MTKTPQPNVYAGDVAPAENDLDQLLNDFGFYESAFLPGQWTATKEELKRLLAKRINPDKATRTAVARCAPSVAKKRFKSDDFGQPAPGARIGGNYQAVDHGNGFFSIMNIEIFAEVPAGAKRNKERIGEDWMDKAIERNRLRRKEGFLPPVHIWHSDETAVKPTYAGKFVLTHRGTITYEGKEIPALFANITDIPAEVFKRIQQGTLPYRSVEVHDWDNPEIDSLALMDTDVPFFRMAMTTIGEIRKQRGPLPVAFKHVMRTPIQYLQELFTQGAEGRTLGARICFRFNEKGANMATDISTVKKGNTSKGLADNVKPASGPGNREGLTGQESGTGGDLGPSSGTATEDQDSMTGLDDGSTGSDGGDDDGDSLDSADIAGSKSQPGGGRSPKMDDGGGPSGGPKGAVKSGTVAGGQENAEVKMDDGMGAGGGPMAQVAALLQQAIQLLQGASQPSAPPAPDAQNTAPVSGMRASAIEKIMLKAVMPLQMKLKALEAKNQKLEADREIKATVLRAKKQLEGWPIDAEIEEQLFKAAKGGYIDEVVSLIQKTQPAEPFESAAQFEASLAELPEGEGVARFMAENPGPKAQEWVRMQARAHADYVSRFGSDMTLEQWLKTNANYEKNTDRNARPSPQTMRSLMGN